MMPDHVVEKCDNICIRLDTVMALDGQTDGRICHNNIALCMHCMLSRDKNGFLEMLTTDLSAKQNTVAHTTRRLTVFCITAEQ